MKGWLVCNGNLSGGKFSDHAKLLMKAAEDAGMELSPRMNDEVIYYTDGNGFVFEETLPDFVLFWDKDIRLAYALEATGARLFNSASAIEKCDDKSFTHACLSRCGIPMPKTVFVPQTFEGLGYRNGEFFIRAGELLGFPMVVKERFGSFGKQVYLVNDEKELFRLVNDKAPRQMLLQKFIAESSGSDLRINVVGDECVAAMSRQSSDGDFRTNATLGGRITCYCPTKAERELAVECCRILGLDFAGVDILFGKDGPLVCEVNSNAHLRNIMNVTGINVAEKIFTRIKTEMEKI